MSETRAMQKIRVEGSWVGVIEVDLVTWTVAMLRAEVANRLWCRPQSVRLSTPKRLLNDADADKTLRQLEFKHKQWILSTRIDDGQDFKKCELLEKRWRGFAVIRDSIDQTALFLNIYSLTDRGRRDHIAQRDGKYILGSWADQRAAFLGMTLHSKAKKTMLTKMYDQAMEYLDLAERVFTLSNSRNLEMLDNALLLDIEIVWCNLMLKDIASVSAAGDRLKKAKEGLEIAIENDFSRIIRFLRGVPRHEIAVLMRVEMLEGVVAYHNGRIQDAMKALESAERKYLQLGVSEEDVTYIQKLGFEEHDTRMALRLNNNNASEAVEFLQLEAANRVSKHLEESAPSALMKVKAVETIHLKDLISVGFDMFLAMEALIKNNHDANKAFTDLTNPRTAALLETQRRGNNRRRTIASGLRERVTNVPIALLLARQTLSLSYMTSDSSSESDEDDFEFFDEEEEEETIEGVEETVREIRRETAPPYYEIEYRSVGAMIRYYKDLVAKQVSETESQLGEMMK